MLDISLEQLQEKVRELANKYPDFVYCADGKTATKTQTCSYLRGGNPKYPDRVGCLFGQALVELGCPKDDWHRYSSLWGLTTSLEFLPIVDLIEALELTSQSQRTDDLTNWCLAVQRQQDMGVPWQEAVKAVDEKTVSFLI